MYRHIILHCEIFTNVHGLNHNVLQGRSQILLKHVASLCQMRACAQGRLSTGVIQIYSFDDQGVDKYSQQGSPVIGPDGRTSV